MHTDDGVGVRLMRKIASRGVFHLNRGFNHERYKGIVRSITTNSISLSNGKQFVGRAVPVLSLSKWPDSYVWRVEPALRYYTPGMPADDCKPGYRQMSFISLRKRGFIPSPSRGGLGRGWGENVTH